MSSFQKFVKNQIKIKKTRAEYRNFYLGYLKSFLKIAGYVLIFVGVTMWLTNLVQYGLVCLVVETTINALQEL